MFLGELPVNSQTLSIYCSKGIPCLQLCCINPSTPPKKCSLATADLAPVALCSAQELLRPRQAGLHNAGVGKICNNDKMLKKMCFHHTGLLWLFFLPVQLPRFSHGLEPRLKKAELLKLWKTLCLQLWKERNNNKNETTVRQTFLVPVSCTT